MMTIKYKLSEKTRKDFDEKGLESFVDNDPKILKILEEMKKFVGNHPCDNKICIPCADDILLSEEQKKGKIECSKCVE